jgi:hypothetical protein
VWGRGWVPAGSLRPGDLLRSADGQRVPVEAVSDLGEESVVYNLRVSRYHTYFVGDRDWPFSLWAHNSYSDFIKAMRAAGAQAKPNALRKRYADLQKLPAAQRRAAFARYIARQLGKEVQDPEVQRLVEIALAPNQGQKGGRQAVRAGQAGEAISSKYYGPKNQQTWYVEGYGNARPDYVLAVEAETGRPTAVAEVKNQPYVYLSTQIKAYRQLVGRDGIVIIVTPKDAVVSNKLEEVPGIFIARVLPPLGHQR